MESVSPKVKIPNTLWFLFPSLKKMWGSHLLWPPTPLPTSLLPVSSHVSSTAALTSRSIWGSLTESQTSLHNSVPCRACSSPGFPVLLWGEAPAPACPPWPQLCAKVGNEVQLDKVWPGESWRVSFLASWLNSSCEPRLLLWTKG